jgi:hypothetical protein
MNISCALSSSQIKGLFKYVYKTMAETLAANQSFNANETMQVLFNKIESNEDADTAAKFLQVVPKMIIVATISKELVSDLKLDKDSSLDNLRSLLGKFLDENNGLLETLRHFRPENTIKDLEDSVIIQGVDINTPGDSEQEEIKDTVRFKASSAFTSTMQQFISKKPGTNKLVVEKIDPARIRIYNTLEKIKLAFSQKNNQLSDIVYQNKVLKLKAIPVSDIAIADLDKTTADLLGKGIGIEYNKSGENFTKDLIALVISDEEGTVINFNEKGDITEHQDGGKPVYQFLRKPTLDTKTGDLVIKDIYGKEERIQTPEDIINNHVVNILNISLAEYKDLLVKDGKTYEQIYESVKKDQQNDFESLLNLRKEIEESGEKLLDMVDISTGVPDFFTQGDIPLVEFLTLSDNLNTNYKFETLLTGRDGIGKGSTVMNVNGNDILVDRKNMSNELITKIADALTNTELSDLTRYNFYEQFSNNNINASRKKLFVSFSNKTGSLILKYKEKSSDYNSFDIDLTNPEEAKKRIIDSLENEAPGYNANLKINADLLNSPKQFFDYNSSTGEVVESSYLDFLLEVNPVVKLEPGKSTGAYNSYFIFRSNEKLNKEIAEAKAKIKNTDTRSDIRKAKDALLLKLTENENISGTVTGGLTQTTFSIQVEGRPVQGRFEEGLSITSVPKNNIVTFTVGDKVENGKLLTDVISIYAGNKKIGQVSETDYKAKEKPRTYEDAKIADEKVINPAGVPQPSVKASTRIGLAFNRSAELPNNVTQEEIDAAQEWWNNSPLSKFIDIEHMANIVNSDVYARFIIAGKRLSDTKIQLDTTTGSSAVDLYHEAWHAFSQLYLTKNQKTKLYAETRKRLNNYDLSAIEVEEILAEEYREYAKNPKAVGDAPIRNTIFRRIWNIIKALFGKRSTQEDLFERLFFAGKNPKLLNKYTPLVDNAMFNTLNRERGVFNAETKELALNYQDSLAVSNQIDSALSQLIDEFYNDRVLMEKEGAVDENYKPIKATRSGTIRLLTDDTNKGVAYNMINARFEENLTGFKNQLEKTDKEDFNKVAVLTDKIRILESALKNWGDSKSGIIKFHIDNSTFDLVKQSYIEIETDDELTEDNDNTSPETAEESEQFANKTVGDKSLLQLAEKETLYILKSLFKVVDGKEVTGKFGFPELADFSKTWNIVTKVIGGEKDPVEMYNKLVKSSVAFPELKQLIANKITNPKEITTLEEFNIKAAFWQDFKKTNLRYIQLTIDNPDGNEYTAEVTDASIEFKNIVNKFISDFKSSPETTYIKKTDDNRSILNLDKVMADFAEDGYFKTDKAIGFANAIGIGLQDLTMLKNEYNSNKKKYGIEYLFDIVTAIHKISKDPNATQVHKAFVRKFISNPVSALYGDIPEGVYEDVTSEKNIIKKLATLQSKFGTTYSSFSVLNPEKNLVNEFIEDNSVSMIVDAINNVEKGKDLWVGDAYKYMSYLNPNINSFTLQSQLLKNIFQNDGVTLNARNGDAKLDLVMVAGTQIVSDDQGANTTSLDVQSKYIQELNMMLKGGFIEFMRHASKSSSFGVKVSNGISGGLEKAVSNLYVDIDMFGPNGNADKYAVNNIFIGYIQAELQRIQTFKSNKDVFKNYKGYNRVVGGTKEEPVYAGEVFTAFDNVLNDTLKTKLIENVKDGDLKKYLKLNPDVKKAVTEQVTDYFNGQTEDNYVEFSKASYFEPGLMNQLNVFTTLDEVEKEKLLVKAHTMNAWIHNFETASLFYGDIVQYNHAKQELHKRNPGSTSGGRGFMTDVYTQNFLTSDIIKKSSYGFKLANDPQFGKDYNTFNYSDTFNTAIMQEVKRSSIYVNTIEKGLREDYKQRGLSQAEIDKRLVEELKPYKKMEEGDGQGYITIDAYRTLRLAENNWSSEQENLFQDIIKNKEVKAEDVVRFFPVYKLQNFGHLANTPLPIMAMHKFALMPLIPSVIKGSDLESLHHQMMKGNIQYATFESGSKVGSIGSGDQIYDNKDQKVLKSDIKFTPNTIYLAYLKNVTAVPNKYKNKTVFSTQLRALILEGLYENGEIVNKEYTPFIEAYENAVDSYTNLLKKDLLEEIGYEKVNGKYVSGDVSKFMDVVQNELERKELPEHLIKYIQVSPNNKITKDLSLHLLSDDIEKIITSLVEKRIVKQKVKGEALVQVASSMTNGLWDKGFKFEEAQAAEIEKYSGTNNLPFYNPESIDLDVKYKDYTKEKLAELLKTNKRVIEKHANYYTARNKYNLIVETEYIEAVLAGKKPKVTLVPGNTSAMKVAIALQGDFNNLLKLNHNDKKPIATRERLNEMIKNDEWLNKGNNRKAITMTSVRIPVQGINSMEFMEVYEFLDPAAGSIIILPSEIVAKSGSDYDVDKLTTFMPNIDSEGHYIETSMTAEDLDKKYAEAKGKGDKVEMARLIKLQKAALENRLIDSIRGILQLPDNYATLVRPNGTYLMKDIADDLVKSSAEYSKYKTISPTNTLEVGYNLHKHEANMVGKDVLGIIAVENKLHPLLTSLGAALPKTYKHQQWSDEKNAHEEIDDVEYDMRLLLDHNKMADGRISLSGINSVDDQDKIADLFSHLMNGSVDVEKDNWIFFIQANKELIPVLLSLLKAGVPKRQAVYFVSQPLVKEYAKQQRLIKSAYSGITQMGVPSPNFIKYKALQNTLGQTTLAFDGQLIREANKLKMFDTLKTIKSNVVVKFVNNKTKETTPKQVLDALANGSVQKSDIANIYIAGEYKTEASGKPSLDPDGNKIPVSINKGVNNKHLLSNENWYYVTQVATKGIKKFTEKELKDNIDKDDARSKEAVAAFLHFIEFEKEIRGISNLKRQANPDTKTSKTIQEVLQKIVSLEEAADSSKVEPELAEKFQKKSIIGAFFDKDIISNVVAPLFNITNNKKVSDFIMDIAKRKGGDITLKFGPGRDGVHAFISAYKNAIVNYIYQNKLYEAVNSDESFPGIPESFTSLDSNEFVEDFMSLVSKYPHLKELYPILEQVSEVTIINKKVKGSNVTDVDVTPSKTITLNNKSEVKGALAEAYHQNLIDLADDNVQKVKNAEENKTISDMFKVLPLMSIYQNGVGNTKYGLSYVVPDNVYFELLEPASRKFLETELNTKTLIEIETLLFKNKPGQNNFIKPEYSKEILKASQADNQLNEEVPALEAKVFNNEQSMTFGTQPSTSVEAKQERIKKVIPNTIVDKLKGYTFNLQELNNVKKIFENTDPLDSETIKDGRVFEDPGLREYGMSDQQYSWAKNNEPILSKLNELLYTDEYSAVNFEDLVSMLIDDNTKLVDTAQTSLFDDESTQQEAPVSEVKEENNTVTYKPTGKEKQTYTVSNNQIFNKNGVEVFKEASSDRNKIFANFAVKQGRAVIVEYKTYTNKEGVDVPAKYVVNNKDVIISVRTGDIMKWPETNGDRKTVLVLAKTAFSEAAPEEPEINKDMTAFNSEIERLGKMPKDFMAGDRKWIMNNMNLYDLVDKVTGDMYLRNMNMFTGEVQEETTSDKLVNQKQLYNFTKQLGSGVKYYKLNELLALKGISIDDIYNDIRNNKIITQSQLNNKINEILKAIC